MFLLLFKSSVSPVLTGNTHTSWQNTREFNNVLSLANLARPCITLYPNLTSVLIATGTSYAVSCLYRNPHLSLVSLFNYSFFNNQLRFYLPYKEIFPPASLNTTSYSSQFSLKKSFSGHIHHIISHCQVTDLLHALEWGLLGDSDFILSILISSMTRTVPCPR